MIQKLISTFRDEISGVAAKNSVAELTRFHRIQASPGYRAAAHSVAETLRGFGLDAEVLSYPADGKTWFWSMLSFLEWDCAEAELHLLDEQGEVVEKLADYREQKISVIQRSMPVDGMFDVVVIEKGDEPSDYAALDVAGKVVLVRERLDRVVDLAVREYGAAGVLFDGMRTLAPIRERIDLPDTRQYTSFWFRGEEEVPVFGFVLTPRQGDALRRRCRQAQADGKPPVRVRAKVVSSRYAGQMEVVTATVPGESNEEIVVTAHLCHPQPSANDNASGSGALMEVARALGACVQSGRLAKPKRTIRFLWIPEMSGTYAYLASHEADIPRMVAGLNLDMVGENQDLCGSSFLVEAPPLSASSFTPILARHIRDGLLSGGKSHAGLGDYPLFRYADTPFSGGSDHYILSDPSVGVPTPMVIQWPDRFYHTSDDTIDKVDPEMLATVGMLTATYAYWLATAQGREASWLAHEMNARFKQWLMERVQKATAAGMESDTQPSEGPGLKREAAFRVSRHGEALATLRRLADIDVGPFQADAAAFADQELKRAESFLGSKAFSAGTPPSDEFEARAASLIPERRYRGPLSVRDLTSKPADRETLYQLSKKYESLYSHGVLAVYWADGVRTLAEIADLLELETGSRSTQMLVSFFELLDRIGAVTLHHKASK